jgi:hypothetical protein
LGRLLCSAYFKQKLGAKAEEFIVRGSPDFISPKQFEAEAESTTAVELKKLMETLKHGGALRRVCACFGVNFVVLSCCRVIVVLSRRVGCVVVSGAVRRLGKPCVAGSAQANIASFGTRRAV